MSNLDLTLPLEVVEYSLDTKGGKGRAEHTELIEREEWRSVRALPGTRMPVLNY